MRKKIEIEFDGEDKGGFTEFQLESLNKLLMRSILDMFEWSTPKKVTVDGNVFWLRTDEHEKMKRKAPAKTYPGLEEKPIIHRVPRLRKETK